MRQAPTRGENRLWSWLRDRRASGFKFRRQFPIGRCVLDFYCPELKLAIELDGRHHATSWLDEYDTQRSLDLRELGVEVLRIPNEMLIRDSLLVGECIRWAIARLVEKRR
jgi:very-short-patch-repair endonuclease